MWKAATNVTAPPPVEADDWETDPDFVNDVSEQEQRWGPAGRNVEAIDMAKLREEVFENDRQAKQKQYEEGPKSSYGYGGKFGVQKDRMDKSAVGHEYIGKVEKHVSQTDYAKGFGGMFGVQTDRVDKSAAGWEHKEQVEKHSSQKDYSVGFGGKFGVQADRKDASAVGWDHKEETQQHNSQKDYSLGFGGKFGVQTDRQDASAVGWDHQEKMPAHASQVDHKKGFGGKFGVETDRVDKSAHGFDDMGKVSSPAKVPEVKEKPTMKVSSMRARFEKISDEKNEEAQKSVQMIRQQREVTDEELLAKEKQKTETQEQPARNIIEKTELDIQAQIKSDSSPQVKPSSPVEVKASPITPQIQKTEPVTPDVVKPESPKLEEAAQQTPETDQPLAEENAPKRQPTVVVSPVGWDTESSELDEDDTGYTARALYDYQAAAPDEISFDPDDIITNIVMVDEGWWQGLCKGAFGLFPANYVQLH